MFQAIALQIEATLFHLEYNLKKREMCRWYDCDTYATEVRFQCIAAGMTENARLDYEDKAFRYWTELLDDDRMYGSKRWRLVAVVAEDAPWPVYHVQMLLRKPIVTRAKHVLILFQN